jgi:type IV secretion system protein VirB3
MQEESNKLTLDQIKVADPLFKGCTRPAMRFGVPLVPLIGVGVAMFLPGMWCVMLSQNISPMLLPVGLVLIFVILPVSIWWMREVTKKDDYRLEQLMNRLTLRARQRNSLLWGKGVAAYSPIQYRKQWR